MRFAADPPGEAFKDSLDALAGSVEGCKATRGGGVKVSLLACVWVSGIWSEAGLTDEGEAV